MVVMEIDRQVLDRPVISPVGTLNEMWSLMNKMYTGRSVRKFGVYWHLGTNIWRNLRQITAKDCTVVEST